MEEHIVKILDIEPVTHDVRRYKIEKPEGYSFIPGQATEVAVNKSGYEQERRPFTFTSLNEWDHLEFTIKSYNDHDGVTKLLGTLNPGDEIILHDVWGTINYKGPGLFIAGGAGVTPFIAILRELHSKNKIAGNALLFANKTSADIINKDEFEKMLGKCFINILSDEDVDGYAKGFVTEDFLKKYISNYKVFYLCGPPIMMEKVEAALLNLGISKESIITEAF
ncbi:MAG TPA: FAD-binding oxidoreductase [Ignavibacteriaceae bacterium]|nr:FAD-binding oxidoreductase [Ignavibacteriaceae bacterium]